MPCHVAYHQAYDFFVHYKKARRDVNFIFRIDFIENNTVLLTTIIWIPNISKQKTRV